jgi:GTP-binding protein
VWRIDPVEVEQERQATEAANNLGRPASADEEDDKESGQHGDFRRDKWIVYPGTLPKSFGIADFPPTPKPRRSHLTALQPPAPLRLDLDTHMETPMLLAAGAMGGLGNPHFVTKTQTRPKFSTKGEDGMKIHLQLELKLLADVGLVGLPNAGKSTLLRAVTRSRTRVGNWAFTTLSPNIGTVVLDTHTGRPALDTKGRRKELRTQFTIADIPGLIEDAHLDRGLGLGFLRHIERAAVLAFVVDLSARDAVEALKALWREVGEYEKLREQELNSETQRLDPHEDGVVAFQPLQPSSPSRPDHTDTLLDDEGGLILNAPQGRDLPALSLPPISSKPWLVIATKADLPDTRENFTKLQSYLKRVEIGEEEHPSGKKNAWRKRMYSMPVSAINKEGVARLPEIVLSLLDD